MHTCDPTHCYEARLTLNLKEDLSAIVGSLDRVSIPPIPLKAAVRANETATSLRYDDNLRALVYTGESASRHNGSPDYILARELLSGADISELGGVGAMAPGGVPVVVNIGGQLTIVMATPAPIESGEVSNGFLTYVPEPNDGQSHVRLLRPDTNGQDDSLLLGRADGSLEFSAPITSPVLIPVSSMTANGIFSGTPETASGVWRYQNMGTSADIANVSGSRVEVTLNFYFSLTTAATHSGVYCKLQNGGSDFRTTFANGLPVVHQEGYPGGYAEFKVILDGNQKCRFEFGAWANAAGNMEVTIGSLMESGKVAYPPTISIRRLV